MARFEERIRTRFFASVDVVGSTQLKQRRGPKPGGSGWARLFKTFYRDFIERVQSSCDTGRGDLRRIVFSTWKLLGDEILLVAEVKEFGDVSRLVKAVVEAVADNNKIATPERLKVKATCWLGHFPFIDREIDVSEHLGLLPNSVLDYIGPSIDSGFRLKEFSTPSRCVLSLDIVYCLLRRDQHFQLFFDSKRHLKGVLDGTPYPVLWRAIGERESFFVAMNGTQLLAEIRRFVTEIPESYFILPDYLESVDRLPSWAKDEVEAVLSDEMSEGDIAAPATPSQETYDRMIALIANVPKSGSSQ